MPKKVLVVDDSKTARRELVRLLHNQGHMTLEAQNGREALHLLSTRSDMNLIFCDLSMPEMNGIEFLEAFRSMEAFASIPVILLTNDGTDELIAKAKSLGAVAAVIKPTTATTLSPILKDHLEKKDAS